MAKGIHQKGKGSEADRKARLAEELRVNLQRRKAQARARRGGAADERPDGLSPGGGKSDVGTKAGE